MNNFKLDVISSGKAHFQLAMQLAARDGTLEATHYGVQGKSRMALFVCCPFDGSWDVRELPSKMKNQDFIEFAWSWLNSGDCNYGPPPSTSEEIQKGFRVFVSEGGFVENMWQAFVCVEPKWEMLGTVTN